MNMQDAYHRVDQALSLHRSGGLKPIEYTLIPAARGGRPVVDFVLPLNAPNREALVTTIRSALGHAMGRDRLTAPIVAMGLSHERRAA